MKGPPCAKVVYSGSKARVMKRKLDYKSSLKADLKKAFDSIDTPGNFAAWEALPKIPPAAFYVNGVGEIDMPLGEEQVRRLIGKAHPARYGPGSQALIDEPVPNTWEIKADELLFIDPAWSGYLLHLSSQVAYALGFNEQIRLDLYRMLICERGAVFKPRTDAERTPGMFGTLIISLPSAYTGGEIVVNHNGECKTFRTSDATQSFACWYSDVTHEVLPVESGYRCVLTYNVAIRPGPTRPAASALDLKNVPLRHTLQRWLGDLSSSHASEAPSHLYHPLGHDGFCGSSTTATSFAELEGIDLTRVNALRGLARDFSFEIFLAFLEKRVRGTAWREGDSSDGYFGYNSNAVHYELDVVLDTSFVVCSLHTADDTIIARDYKFDPSFCLVQDPFHFLDIAEEDYEDEDDDRAYGTNWYRRSALVIVPHAKIGDYLIECTAESTENDETSESTCCNHTYEFDDWNELGSALRYLGQIDPVPSAQITHMLDAMCILYVSKPSKQLPITILLKAALEYTHYTLFQTVGIDHQGRLPIYFFDWVEKWLDALPDADRTAKYQKWIPLLIQGYPSMADSISIIKKMSNPDTPLSNSTTWERDVIRQCIQRFPETNKKPTPSDAKLMVSALFDRNEAWTDTAALLTSLFDRLPQANATAFLLNILAQLLKAHGRAVHPPTSETIELYRNLSLRVFNPKRRLSSLITASKAKEASRNGLEVSIKAWHGAHEKYEKKTSGLVVTPKALVQFACDLTDLIRTDAADLLRPFIQEITAQCITFSTDDLRELWMPFLYQLILALSSRAIPLDTPTYQQLTRQLLKNFEDKAIGPFPQAGLNFPVPEVECSCEECGKLNRFLRNTCERTVRFQVADRMRKHLWGHLKRARIACTVKDIVTDKDCKTLVVTKQHTLQDMVNGWKRRQNKVYGMLTRNIPRQHLESLLGVDEAARVRSLAARRQAATKPHGLLI
ncbi:hypothetical protein MJO28_000061 [Puccinia striiformis f. sp. tritici]|uniref:Uncharacterized protein n=1 Tax=Puccinia striiformis f. sp. tritici TaxID=168172 RepID=A0ACC0EX18_9BASI|nr:hypothetical protein MJO28_000061 [Puccinia striiformis f. sp. tritici]